jgi:hypothetical protein
MTSTAAAVGQGFIPCIVLVHWPSTRDVLDGIKSWLSVVEGHQSLLSRPDAWEISFLDWKALEAFGHPLQDISHMVESFSYGSIAYRD